MAVRETRVPAARGEGVGMLLALLSVVPVGLCLSLLAFGTPERPLLATTPRSYAIVAAATVVIGPGALGVLGIVGWLLALALLIAAFVVIASVRGGGGSARGRRRGPVARGFLE